MPDTTPSRARELAKRLPKPALPLGGYMGADSLCELRTALRSLADQVTRLEPLVYVPGVWRCAKCNFRLVQSNLNAHDGTVTARDEPGEKCPNDGAPLWRVTHKDDVADAYERWEEQVQRAVAAETSIAALTKERDALREARDRAYGFLWMMQPVDRGNYKDDLACRARESLLTTMSRENQANGIEAARAALKETDQ